MLPLQLLHLPGVPLAQRVRRRRHAPRDARGPPQPRVVVVYYPLTRPARRQERAARPARRWRRRAGAPRRCVAAARGGSSAPARLFTTRRPRLGPRLLDQGFALGHKPSLVAPRGLQPWAKAPPSLGGALVAPWWRLGGALVAPWWRETWARFYKKVPTQGRNESETGFFLPDSDHFPCPCHVYKRQLGRAVAVGAHHFLRVQQKA